MSHNVRQLVYLSNARPGLEDGDIENILTTSRRNNGARDVTGLLLFSDGVFIQALEGIPAKIESMFQMISADQRHDQLDVLFDGTVPGRTFAAWAMAYIETSPEEMGQWSGADRALNRAEALALLSDDKGRVADFLWRFARALH